jgi:site-specific DNA-methyltransferase (adenine-specific)
MVTRVPYTLHHGDCLDILPTLQSGSVDAIITDPPYGTTACKWDSVIPFEPMWRELKRIIKPRGAIVLFGSQPFTSALVMSNPGWFKCEWVWRKTRASNFAAVQDQPLRVHESLLIFADGSPNYYPQMWSGEAYKTRTRVDRDVTVFGTFKGNNYNPNEVRTVRYPVSVVDVASMRQQDRIHPTQKPTALLEYLVKTYTHAGDTVLDFTMGSGTTGEACITTGRDFIGIERERQYYDIAARRLETAAARLVQMDLAI